LKKFKIQIGQYTLTALANATTIIEIDIGKIKSIILIFPNSETINQINIKTIEFETKAKNSHICST